MISVISFICAVCIAFALSETSLLCSKSLRLTLDFVKFQLGSSRPTTVIGRSNLTFLEGNKLELMKELEWSEVDVVGLTSTALGLEPKSLRVAGFSSCSVAQDERHQVNVQHQ